MEIEKRTSKGGFLYLFDWGVKSRKKLFLGSSNSELPVRLEEASCIEKLPISLHSLIEVNDSKASSTNKGSNEYNCASSVTSDESNGARAPGVVVKLMGLDSLPTSSIRDSCSTSSIGSSSFKDTRCNGKYTNLQCDYHNVDCNIMQSKVKELRNPMCSEPQNQQSSKIERFQTEVLPRKSAKSILLTHNKLLSPIKSPAFIPTKTKAYTMEVAAKMIEPSPQSKRTSFISSSVPIRIRDLKETMEAAQKASRTRRPQEKQPISNMNEQLSHKNTIIHNRSENTSFIKISIDKDKYSFDGLKNKRKLMSLPVQTKVDEQRKGRPASSSIRRSMIQKEPNDIKSNQLLKSQPNTQTNGHKRTLNGKTSSVLQQSNIKQNNIPNKDRSTSKVSFSNQQARKLTNNVSSVPDKAVDKVVRNSEKERSPSRPKTSSQKKHPVNDDIYFEESAFYSDTLICKDGRSIQCNTVVDGGIGWGTDKRKGGTDVVSFTFSSPIKRTISESRSSSQSMENNGCYLVDSHGQNNPIDTKFTSHGLNVIGADVLSIILEQKLKELTYKIESPHCNLVEADSACSLKTSVLNLNLNLASTKSSETEMGSQVGATDGLYDSDGTSINDLVLNPSQELQEEDSCDSTERGSREEIDFLHPIQLSSPEPLLSNDNCYSVDGRNKGGSKHYAWGEPHEEANSISVKEFQQVEDERELSDSVSSMFTVDMGSKNTDPLVSLTDFMRTSNWELQYVKDILENAETMVTNFALGQACEIITPNLFDLFEREGRWEERNEEGYPKLERKVLFDCVRECLDIKCRKLYTGSFETRAKWVTQFQKKGWLTNELYKDISNLKNMEDLIVDELVDNDMSTELGKWLDFKFEAFEEGMEIEQGLLHSLVDELVTDIFVKHL